MNKKQKYVAIIAGLIICGITLFPPWVGVIGYQGSGAEAHYLVENEGRQFIFLPPDVTNEADNFVNYHIDYARLLYEWLAIFFPSSLLFLVLHTFRKT